MSNIINNLKDFILSDNGVKIIGFVVTIGIAYITAKLTSQNEKKSFTTQYFKEKGVAVQEKVLKFWSALVLNNFNVEKTYNEVSNNKDKKNDVDILIEIQKDSYIYCSAKTIKAISSYQQYLYKNKNNIKMNEDDIIKGKKENSKKDKIEVIKDRIKFYKMFILITRIISRMKYDFTGENVDELDIIKMKITDFNFSSRILCKILVWYYNLKDLLIKLVIIIVLILLVFNILKIYV